MDIQKCKKQLDKFTRKNAYQHYQPQPPKKEPGLQAGRTPVGWGGAAALFPDFYPFPWLLLEMGVLGQADLCSDR